MTTETHNAKTIVFWQLCRGLQNLTDVAIRIALAITATALLPPTQATLLVATSLIMSAVAMLPAGVLADRLDSKKVIVLALVLEAAIATVGGFALFLLPHVVLVAVIVALLGLTNAVAGAAFATVVPQVVPEEHFTSTMGTGQAIDRAAGIAGAPLGAAAISVLSATPEGFAVLLLCHAGGVVTSAIGVWLWLQLLWPKTPTTESMLKGITSGWRIISRDAPLRHLVLSMVGSNIWSAPVLSIGLVLALKHSGAALLWVGVCQGAVSVAALVAVTVLGKTGTPTTRWGFIALVGQGFALMAIGTGVVSVLLGAAIIVGVTAGVASLTLSRAYVALVDPAALGRVSSVLRFSDLALVPVSILVFGVVAEHSGPMWACVFFGVGAAGFFARGVVTTRP